MMRTSLIKKFGLTPQRVLMLTGSEPENLELVQQTLRRLNHNTNRILKADRRNFLADRVCDIFDKVESGQRLFYDNVKKEAYHWSGPAPLNQKGKTNHFVEYVNNLIAEASSALEKSAPARKAKKKGVIEKRTEANKIMKKLKGL